MARKRKPGRTVELSCHNCGADFIAQRDDAQTCGPKCRQQLSREKRRSRGDGPIMSSLKGAGTVRCVECGITRDGRFIRCQVCGSIKTIPA